MIQGILGGMGPYATLAFFNKVLDLTPVKKDSDHLHLLIDNNPKVPSRNRHILYGEESPVKMMIESVERLKSQGAEAVYLPCNSASYFLSEVSTRFPDYPIVGTIAPTVDWLQTFYPDEKKVMVLGAHIVYQLEPYRQLLEAVGYSYIKHCDETQIEVERLIYGVKGKNFDPELLARCESLLRHIVSNYSIDVLVLGCTELCILFDALKNLPVIVVDTNAVLAKKLVTSVYEG